MVLRRIMILASTLHIGGAERVIANLAKYIDRSRFRVVVCHLKERGVIGDEIARLGAEIVGVPANHGIRRYFSFRALAKMIQAHDIELIHSHTTYSFTDGALCRLFGRRRVRLVHTFHFGNYPHYPFRYRIVEGAASRIADRLVAVGQEQAKIIASTYALRLDRLDSIVNGVDVPIPRQDPEWRERLARAGRVVIGTICTFIEQKGLPDLLRTAQALKASGERAVFVVVGDGHLRAGIERECAAMGLSDVVYFAGWKNEAGATMMPLFDIFFQPSLWEAMSMVVLEAMAAGKPVVATDVGDNRHVVRDGETGFVVSVRDVTAMSDALRRLVRSDDKRSAFGAAGRRRFEDHYTVQSMVRHYEELYLATLESPRKDTAKESAFPS